MDPSEGTLGSFRGSFSGDLGSPGEFSLQSPLSVQLPWTPPSCPCPPPCRRTASHHFRFRRKRPFLFLFLSALANVRGRSGPGRGLGASAAIPPSPALPAGPAAAMTEQMTLRGTLKGHNGWVTQIATTPQFPDMILSASRGERGRKQEKRG